MNKLRRYSILLTIAVTFLSIFVLPQPPKAEANPVACNGPVVMFGRQRWCGYFRNIGYSFGAFVRNGGVPGNVNTAQEFINLIIGDLNSGNAHRVTSAKFIILTMIGRGPGAPQSVTQGQIDDWVERVRSYANFSENGTTSTGENGRIDWSVWQHLPCGTTNTYYQVAQNDVAPYFNSAGNSDCELNWVNDEFLLFRDTAGNVDYRIRRECMNPMGTLQSLEQPEPDQYNLVPEITATVDNGPVSGGAEVGQTIRFTYSVRNTDRDPSPANTACTVYTNVHVGFFAARSSPPPGGGAGPPTGCPRSFPPFATTPLGGVEQVPVGVGNRTICRSLVVGPASASVATRSVEACVPVVNKPYFKVFGGDVSAGNGLQNSLGTCAGSDQASVIGWNRGNSGGYGGAGVQFGVFALRRIYEATTAVGNTGPNLASVPRGLAFAGNNQNGSMYGGSFGSLPCIADYYASRPSDTMSFTTLAAADTSGAYSRNGAGVLSLSGALNPGKRVTLYVDGDVFINGNLTYPASWDHGTMPLFQLVARGNIYIHNSVSRIDGIFIAQRNVGSNSGGAIYTCTLGAAPLNPDGALYNRCNRKLTINGAFVAHQVRLLRTNGTRQIGTGSEAKGSANIAEEFNFGPAIWMAQPVGPDTSPAQYDSITALPPIL